MLLIYRILLLCILSADEFEKLKKGDSEVITKIYMNHGEAIYNFIKFKLNHNKHITDDIFQDTFTAALQSFQTLKTNTNILGWFISIAKAQIFYYFRKENKNNNTIEKLKLEKNNLSTNNSLLEKKQKFLLMDHTMTLIKPIYKTVLEMKYKKKMKVKDIAKLLNKTEKAIESLLVRARKTFKQKINKLYQDELE